MIAALACCSMVAARADENTGVVEGTMQFANAAPAANIPLLLGGPFGLQYSSTNRTGHFIFFNVIPGRYALILADGYTLGEHCGMAPVIDVKPGLTWHLTSSLPAVHVVQATSQLCAPQATALPQQLMSEGTTSDLYLVGGNSF
jgi:hypothetical protein